MQAYQNKPSSKLLSAVILLVVESILCNPVRLNAQMLYSFNPPNSSRTAHAQYIRNLNQKIDPGEPEIKGSPYLNEAFVKGHVYSSIGNFSEIEMRYNIFYDYIEFMEKGQRYALDPNILVQKIQLGDQTFVVDFLEEKGVSTPMFLIRLDSGKVTLLSKKRLLFKEQQLGKPIEGDIPASYNQLPDTYYYKVDNGPLLKVQNIKKMIAGFPDKKQELEEYAKKEKISSNDPEELSQLIRYYNSLD